MVKEVEEVYSDGDTITGSDRNLGSSSSIEKRELVMEENRNSCRQFPSNNDGGYTVNKGLSPRVWEQIDNNEVRLGSLDDNSSNATEWNRQFLRLKDFYSTYGHFGVHVMIGDCYEDLAEWLRQQRDKFKSNDLCGERLIKLVKCGVNLHSNEGSTSMEREEMEWYQSFESLRCFKRLYGSLQLNLAVGAQSSEKENKQKQTNASAERMQTSPIHLLAQWCDRQQKEYRKFKINKDSKLTVQKIDRLNNLGFNWNFCEEMEGTTLDAASEDVPAKLLSKSRVTTSCEREKNDDSQIDRRGVCGTIQDRKREVPHSLDVARATKDLPADPTSKSQLATSSLYCPIQNRKRQVPRSFDGTKTTSKDEKATKSIDVSYHVKDAMVPGAQALKEKNILKSGNEETEVGKGNDVEVRGSKRPRRKCVEKTLQGIKASTDEARYLIIDDTEESEREDESDVNEIQVVQEVENDVKQSSQQDAVLERRQLYNGWQPNFERRDFHFDNNRIVNQFWNTMNGGQAHPRTNNNNFNWNQSVPPYARIAMGIPHAQVATLNNVMQNIIAKEVAARRMVASRGQNIMHSGLMQGSFRNETSLALPFHQDQGVSFPRRQLPFAHNGFNNGSQNSNQVQRQRPPVPNPNAVLRQSNNAAPNNVERAATRNSLGTIPAQAGKPKNFQSPESAALASILQSNVGNSASEKRERSSTSSATNSRSRSITPNDQFLDPNAVGRPKNTTNTSAKATTGRHSKDSAPLSFKELVLKQEPSD